MTTREEQAEFKSWLDTTVPYVPSGRVIVCPTAPVAHPDLLSGLIVLTSLFWVYIDKGKWATAAHAKRAALNYARKRVDWSKF